MKFIERITAKKEIIKIIDQTQIIYKEAFNCLKPSKNVYYHYEFYKLRMTRSDHDVSLQEISQSFISFDCYIKQLVNLKIKLKHYLQDKKLKTKFSNNYKTIKSYFKILYSDVNSLINNIHDIKEYRDMPDLKLILNLLEQNKIKLQQIAKIEEEVITKAN